MSTNGKQAAIPANDENLLISRNVGGPHTMVERTITVQSMKLPETGIAEVEMIEIKENVIPLPSATMAAAPKQAAK